MTKEELKERIALELEFESRFILEEYNNKNMGLVLKEIEGLSTLVENIMDLIDDYEKD